MTDLLPCPFCGGEAAEVKFVDYDEPVDAISRVGFKCQACPGAIGFEGPISERSYILARWNTRSVSLFAVYGSTPANPTEVYGSREVEEK